MEALGRLLLAAADATSLLPAALTVILLLAFVFLWLDYKRLKSKYEGIQTSESLSKVNAPRQNSVAESSSSEVTTASSSAPSTSSFRKRDRVAFLGRRLARRMSTGLAQKTIRAERMAKNFLSMYPDGDEDRAPVAAEFAFGPAEECLDEEMSESGDSSGASWVPPELSYLLNSFHMFGHFDQSLFLELCRSIQMVSVPAGQYLFRVGDADEFVHVVQSGRMNVHIREGEKTTTIKIVEPGETVSSLLSFIDVLTGYPSPFKTVCCKALTDSLVIKLPAAAFADVFDKNAEMLIRVVQMAMARLQRVIFVGLHQHIGLSSELIRQIVASSGDNKSSDDVDARHALQPKLDDYAYDMTMNAAVKAFQDELDIDNGEFLRERIELRSLSPGDVIMTEDSHHDAALVFIVSGSLLMSQRNEVDVQNERMLYTAYQGECVGQLAMLTGEANFYSCRAQESSRVAILTRDTFFSIVSESPEMVLRLAHSVISRLSPLVRQVDFALDWLHVESGKALFHEGDPTDGTFIVLSGRLRAFVAKPVDSTSGSASAKKQVMENEYIRGDIVGLVGVITSTPRHSTVIAVRDCELCKIPSSLLNLLKQRYPVVVSKLISFLGHRLLGRWNSRPGLPMSSSSSTSLQRDASPSSTHSHGAQASYTSVALFASSPNVPLTNFALELQHALTVCGPVVRLSSSIVLEKLGAGAFDAARSYRLNAWLGLQEHRHKVVIYECDYEMTKWTSRCLRQADIIFDLVLAVDGEDVRDEAFVVRGLEHELEVSARRVRKELVLIHPESTLVPRYTRNWLKTRPWVSAHFHLRAPARMMHSNVAAANRAQKTRANDFYSRRIWQQAPNINSDFSRLARHITGSSVGLVLGGGGARGAAHIGMIKAVQEAGIPIDRVGGVSIGSFVGGLWSSCRDVATVTQRARHWFDLVGNRWLKPLLDFTYPTTSLFTGDYFNWTVKEVFGEELAIEDLWLPFFCCTTDITLSQERVHTKGVFWRYCRASMSYAWILPPLCDPVDGHLIMDGCYVNNVPGDVMAAQGCKYILAIDVAAVDDRDLTNYGDSLSGWWVLLQKLNPFASVQVKIPGQSEIQMRLSFCSHYKNLEDLKSNPNYEYIQPPVDRFSAGNFKLFDEIRMVGYHHGSTFFAGLRKASASNRTDSGSASSHYYASSASPGSSPPWFPGPDHYSKYAHYKNRERRSSGVYTFTDLAEMVCGGMTSNSASRSVSVVTNEYSVQSVTSPPSRNRSRASSMSRRERSGSSASTASSLARKLTARLEAGRPQPGPSPLPRAEQSDESDDTGIAM